MPVRDLWGEYLASRPTTPYGTPSERYPNGRGKIPLFATAESILRKSPGWPVPSSRKPLGMEAGVYRFYNSESRLLYVGHSTVIPSRYRQHRDNTSSQWRKSVHHDAPIDWYPTLADAKLAEMQAMHREHPLYNENGIWSYHRYGPDNLCTGCGEPRED